MTSWGRSSLLLAMAVVALACSGLGVWQLKRLAARKAANAEALRQRLEPEVDLNVGSLPPSWVYRRAVGAGRFDESNQFLIRGRVHQGTPGIHVVTPLRLSGRDTAVLVNRGFVPTADAGPPGAGLEYGEPGDMVVRGVAMPVPDAGDGAPVRTGRGESWGRLDLTRMRARVSYPLASHYLIAMGSGGSAPSPGGRGRLPIRIEPPALSNGPHLAYAIQWFLIGGAALAFGIAYSRRAARA